MENCIFCKIANGEIPSFKVWEDENYFAFLDLHPIKEGHTLVVSKRHISYIFDMADDELSKIILASKTVSQKLKKAFNPKSGKVGVVVYGLDVDHVHIHLVPIDKSGDLSFSNSKTASKEDLEKTLNKIQSM